KMLEIDPIHTPSVLQQLADDIHARERRAREFTTLEEAVSQSILWAMDIDLSSKELDSDVLARIKHLTVVIFVLADDYFSWERE
ncbi:hypothetical protein L218DRAFT_881736, partial [Marasmius fiardii PR-910]